MTTNKEQQPDGTITDVDPSDIGIEAAKLTSQVASGEVIGYVHPKDLSHMKDVGRSYIFKSNCVGCIPVYTTPSPSNVLVEALREVDNWISHGCNRDELDVPRKKARDAILAYEATYSASTDSALPNEEVK